MKHISCRRTELVQTVPRALTCMLGKSQKTLTNVLHSCFDTYFLSPVFCCGITQSCDTYRLSLVDKRARRLDNLLFAYPSSICLTLPDASGLPAPIHRFQDQVVYLCMFLPIKPYGPPNLQIRMIVLLHARRISLWPIQSLHIPLLGTQ